MSRPFHEIRALQRDGTVRVYQAFSPAIAEPALRAGRFVEPFRRERMTWVKPSFLWMMYRSSWGTSRDQERVLGIDIRRDALDQALSRACLSTFKPNVHGTSEAWKAQLSRSPVRVQWDPERGLGLQPLSYRAIQIGLSGAAVDQYVDSWIEAIHDVTALAHQIRAARDHGRRDEALSLLPEETPLVLRDASTRERIQISPVPEDPPRSDDPGSGDRPAPHA